MFADPGFYKLAIIEEWLKPRMAISPLVTATYGSGTAVWQRVRIDRPMPLAEREEFACGGPHSDWDQLCKLFVGRAG